MAGKITDQQMAVFVAIVIKDIVTNRGINIPRGSSMDAKAAQKIAHERVSSQLQNAGHDISPAKVAKLIKSNGLDTAKARDAILKPAAQKIKAETKAAKEASADKKKGISRTNVAFAKDIAAKQAKIPYQAPKRAADTSSRARAKMPTIPPLTRAELRLAKRLFPGISDSDANKHREHIRPAVQRGASAGSGNGQRRSDRFIERGYQTLKDSAIPGVKQAAPASIMRMATAKYTPTPSSAAAKRVPINGQSGEQGTGSTARGTRYFTADQAAFMRSDPRAVRQYMKLRRSDAGRRITITQRIPGSQSIPARTVSTPLRGAARAGKIVDLIRTDRAQKAIRLREDAKKIKAPEKIDPANAKQVAKAAGEREAVRQVMANNSRRVDSTRGYVASKEIIGSTEHASRIDAITSKSITAGTKIFGPSDEKADTAVRGSAEKAYAHAVERFQQDMGIKSTDIKNPQILAKIDEKFASPESHAAVIRSSVATMGGKDTRKISQRIRELAASKSPADRAIAQRIADEYMPGKINVARLSADADRKEKEKAKEPVKSVEPKKVSARAKQRTEEFKKHDKETKRREAANKAAGKGEKPYPKVSGDRATLAKAVGLRSPNQTKPGLSEGYAHKGILSNQDIVGAAKARAAGSSPEIADRKIIANTIASKVAGSQAVSGAPKAILEAMAADPKIAKFYLGEGATAITGVKGKDIERQMTQKEILDAFAAKNAAAEGKAPKLPKSGKAPKAPKAEKAPAAKPAVKPSAAAPAKSSSKPAAASGGSGGGAPKDRKQIAIDNMKTRYGMEGAMQGKIKAIDAHIKSQGIDPATRKQILSRIEANVNAKVAGGMKETDAWKSIGMLGKNLAGSDNIKAIVREAKAGPGAIEKTLNTIAPSEVAKMAVPPAEKKPAAAKVTEKAATKAAEKTETKPAAPTVAAKATPKPEATPKTSPKAKTSQKPAQKPAAKAATQKPIPKAQTKPVAQKSAPKAAPRSAPKEAKKPAAAKVTKKTALGDKPVRPMSKEKQIAALAASQGYSSNSGAGKAYMSLLKKGVDPATAKGIVEDGKKSGIAGKQLERYANNRQRGMDHDTAKAVATARKASATAASAKQEAQKPSSAGVEAKPARGGKGGGGKGEGGGGGKNRRGGGGGGGQGPQRPTTTNRGDYMASGGGGGGGGGKGGGRFDPYNQGGAIGGAGQLAGQITKSVITAQVIGKVGAILGQITGGLIGFNMKIEEAGVAFQTLFENEQRAMGTWQGDSTMAKLKAADITKQIQNFANVTPFRFPELVTAAERMKAFGFETKTILPNLQAIGDAVAALGGEDDKLRRITYALGQMKQAGRVYQNDMMQLSNAGIAGYEILGKGLLKQIIETGRVTIAGTEGIIDKNASNIDQSVNDIVAKQGAGYKVISATRQKYNDMFEALALAPVEAIRSYTKKGIIEGHAAANTIMQGLETTYQGGMRKMSRTMQGAISTMQDTSQYLIALSFKPAYDGIRDLFYKAGQFMMKEGGQKIAKSVAKSIQPLSDTFFRVIPKMGKLFSNIVSGIAKPFINLYKAMQKVKIDGQGMITFLTNRLGKGVMFLSEIFKNRFVQAILAAAVAFKVLTTVMAANPIIIVISGAVMALGQLTQGIDKLKKAGGISKIGEIAPKDQKSAAFAIRINEAMSGIARTMQRLKSGVGPAAQRFFEVIVTSITDLGTGSIDRATKMISAFLTTTTGVLQSIAPYTGELAKLLVAFIGFKVAAGGVNMFVGVINTLVLAISSLAGAMILFKGGGMKGILGGLMEKGGISRAAGLIGRTGAATRSGIMSAEAASPIAKITEAAASTGQPVGRIGPGNILKQGKMALRAIFGKGPEGTTLLSEKVAGAGRAIKVGAPAGEYSVIKTAKTFDAAGRPVVGAATNIASKIEFTKPASGIAKFAAGVGNIFTKGKGAAGFFATLGGGIKIVAKQFGIWGVLVPIIIDNIGNIIRFIGSFIGFIFKLISGLGGLISALGPVGEAIKAVFDIIDSVVGFISTTFGKIINALSDGMDQFGASTESTADQIANYKAEIIDAGYSEEDAIKIATELVAMRKRQTAAAIELARANGTIALIPGMKTGTTTPTTTSPTGTSPSAPTSGKPVYGGVVRATDTDATGKVWTMDEKKVWWSKPANKGKTPPWQQSYIDRTFPTGGSTGTPSSPLRRGSIGQIKSWGDTAVMTPDANNPGKSKETTLNKAGEELGISDLGNIAGDAYIAAIAKAIAASEDYKATIIKLGATEKDAEAAARAKLTAWEDEISATVDNVAATQDWGSLIDAVTAKGDSFSVATQKMSGDVSALRAELQSASDGSYEITVYIIDQDGNPVKDTIKLVGSAAESAGATMESIQAIIDRYRAAIVDTGAVSGDMADVIVNARMNEISAAIGDAALGWYTNADGVREYIGQTLAISKVQADMKKIVGVNWMDLLAANLEDKLERAKQAAEKLKAIIDPLVDGIIKRLQNSAEDQFAARIEHVTSILEEQRKAELDAIQVRSDGINTTYGQLQREIAAQDKKNRLLTIEKSIIDARKNVAMAALAGYGDNADPLQAAIQKREADQAMTDAVQKAQEDMKKITIENMDSTAQAVQDTMDLRIDIVTKALDDERMAFQENIDAIVQKIKDGSIKGQAAVNAIKGAFSQFSIALPANVQQIGQSGIMPISKGFQQIQTAVDRYYNKLQLIKKLEDQLGSITDTPTPTDQEVLDAKNADNAADQITRNRASKEIMSTALKQYNAAWAKWMAEITSGKPISAQTTAARNRILGEYNLFIKSKPSNMGSVSEKDFEKIMKSYTGFTGFLQSPEVDLFTPPRARGGPVAPGGTYLVGERGPEILTIGRTPGEVISNYYVKGLTDTFKKFSIGSPRVSGQMSYNTGGKTELSVVINNPQVRNDQDIERIVQAVNRSQMRMARKLGLS